MKLHLEKLIDYLDQAVHQLKTLELVFTSIAQEQENRLTTGNENSVSPDSSLPIELSSADPFSQ